MERLHLLLQVRSDSSSNDSIQLRLMRPCRSHRGGVDVHQCLQCGDVVLLKVAQRGGTDSVLRVSVCRVAHKLQQGTLAIAPCALLESAEQCVCP